MSSFLKLAIGLILLGSAYGASVATSSDKNNANCTLADGFRAISCLMRVSDFVEKIDELDMDDKAEVKEFKKSCDSLEASCYSLMKCGKQDKEVEEAFGTIKNYCNAVVYVSNDFAQCGEKLETKKSTCYDDWDPFPDNIEEEKDENKKEALKKEACLNYFGKDNCLKKEITETCSKKEWEGFRDHFKTISAILGKCDFSALD